MAEREPLHLQADGADADDVRRFIASVSNDSEGVVRGTDLAVTENGTPNMSVDVAAGRAFILGDSSAFQGTYHVENDATVNLAIAAADPTDPRKDLVVAQVRDDTEDSGGNDDWVLAVVQGTAAPSPTEPTVPDTAIVLALVDVAAAATSITNGVITDRRTVYNPRYQVVPFTATGTFEKADYPWARAAKITVVGGGGGGGGVEAAGGGEAAVAIGGGGGGTAIARVLLDDMAASETVTVGAGGSAGASGANNGGAGGDSSFGTFAAASGGEAGSSGSSSPLAQNRSGGNRGVGTTGDILLYGGSAKRSFSDPSGFTYSGDGGDSSHGTGGKSVISFGDAGEGYGAGGSGGATDSGAFAGGAGAPGIVIVELFG